MFFDNMYFNMVLFIVKDLLEFYGFVKKRNIFINFWLKF